MTVIEDAIDDGAVSEPEEELFSCNGINWLGRVPPAILTQSLGQLRDVSH